MSRSPCKSPGRQVVESQANRLASLAAEMESLADKHCETLAYEGYTGLTEHVAQIECVVRLVRARDQVAVLRELVEEAERHLAFFDDFFDMEVER